MNSHLHYSEWKSESKGDLLQLSAGPFHHLIYGISSKNENKGLDKEDLFMIYCS